MKFGSSSVTFRTTNKHQKMDGIDAAERRRIADLVRTVKDGGKAGSSMDWMYTDKKHNAEDYLLGKKIDKSFEQKTETPPKEDDIFGERIKANIALDMQAKMREDPLYLIKKREEESKMKILQNPVKMKELQQLIVQQKKDRKKKSNKKQKQESSKSDDELVQKYISILSHKHGQREETKRKHLCSEDDYANDEHIQSAKRKANRKELWPTERSDTDSVSAVHCSGRKHSGGECGRRKYGLIKNDHHDTAYSRSRSPTTRKQQQSSLSDDDRSQRSHHQHQRRKHHHHERQSPIQSTGSSTYHKKHPPSYEKRKLTNIERERRLQEMMENAKWRENQRKSNVHRYKEEDKKEEEMRKKKEGVKADFLNPLMSDHASNSTIEDRLRRNKYNIQRTKAALDKDFTKH